MPEPRVRFREMLAALVRSWVDLTEDEQRVVAVVLGIFLLGLLARWWYLTH